MEFLETKEKRIAAIIAAVFTSILLLAFTFVTVLTELEPPEEQGIAINFGNTDVGTGPTEPAQPTKVVPSNSTPTKEPEIVDNVATQENTDAPTIKSDPKVEKPVKKPTEKPAEKLKPNTSVLDALNSVSGAKPASGNTSTGEGPGDGPGNKGDINGDPYSNTYFGGPGSGSEGKGFGLNGRSKVGGGQTQPDCFETGRVIVEIEVDRAGKVTKATPGKKGTTNRAQCLLDAARRTAMTWKFSAAPEARPIQIGYIEVNFKVGE